MDIFPFSMTFDDGTWKSLHVFFNNPKAEILSGEKKDLLSNSSIYSLRHTLVFQIDAD